MIIIYTIIGWLAWKMKKKQVEKKGTVLYSLYGICFSCKLVSSVYRSI